MFFDSIAERMLLEAKHPMYDQILAGGQIEYELEQTQLQFWDKVIMASFRSTTPPRMLEQKDRLVRKLKAEILPLKQTEHTLPMLQHTARELIERIRALGEDKGLVDTEFRMRIEAVQRTVTELRAEYERLKGVGKTLQLEQTDLNADNASLKSHLEKSDHEVDRLRQETDGLYATNELLLIETNKLLHSETSLSEDIHHLRSNASSLGIQNTDLTSRLSATKNLLSSLQSQKEEYIAEIRKFEDLNNAMEVDNNERDHAQELKMLEIRKKDENIKLELDKLMEAESKAKRIRNETAYKEDRLRAEADKGRELEAQIRNAEAILKDDQAQLKLEEASCRDLTEQNANAHQMNTKISQDMVLCETHLENLMIQNQMLNKELEKFADEDEFIKKVIAARRKIKPLTEYVLKNSRMNATAY